MCGIKGTEVILFINYFTKVISGSIIAFIASPNPAIATKNAVMFSISAFAFVVAGSTESKSFRLNCIKIFFAVLKMSMNFDTK